ncbi:2-polyprenyl-3-methyl-5-hydroxy-6-metoxy-1,4-benzoquinol methylase [Methylohalomonas lacus]|uniref:2-polyprenyl-3-methyl-5-hydroxy-6-metoxy-1, 4-benzoquinol methylase n=1 Tax=Methylohalomonas lacus TaxID=398773 RepID=A0AAE3HL37_9GAMM|nr:class I SAM-dependent methyltransferase [Methylohalomonas lacus]MCS3902443.1 2-polyprenyl-3-methyl-5-hydroxy-6-metoxy-1,4-benzoquinol methylase [Methylohalomonas lacus]
MSANSGVQSAETATPARHCPLCADRQLTLFAEVKHKAQQRLYYQCNVCWLIHLDPSQRPDPTAEKAHYDTHDNDPADPGYRKFLYRLVEPLVPKLRPGATGLDYGAGPGPTLSVMLGEQGFSVTNYDPIYVPDTDVLERDYDFITCTETAEHFFRPGREFERLNALLRPGGWLGLMTMRRDPQRPFASWHYIRDPTHVCFYEQETLEWIAMRFGWRLIIVSKSVALFHKPGGTQISD